MYPSKYVSILFDEYQIGYRIESLDFRIIMYFCVALMLGKWWCLYLLCFSAKLIERRTCGCFDNVSDL